MTTSGDDLTAPSSVDELTASETRAELLRSVVPPAVAVVLLFGTVIAGALALRGLLDFGVWFLGSY